MRQRALARFDRLPRAGVGVITAKSVVIRAATDAAAGRDQGSRISPAPARGAAQSESRYTPMYCR